MLAGRNLNGICTLAMLYTGSECRKGIGHGSLHFGCDAAREYDAAAARRVTVAVESTQMTGRKGIVIRRLFLLSIRVVRAEELF